MKMTVTQAAALGRLFDLTMEQLRKEVINMSNSGLVASEAITMLFKETINGELYEFGVVLREKENHDD